jgi:nitrate reductase gamma subunit
MGIGFSFATVVLLGFFALVGVGAANLQFLFGVIIPYLALAIFAVGMVYRVVKWASSPVPFRITTTCGQQKSLPWIQSNRFESPSNALDVAGRMALEILFFRSLFRNTRAEVRGGPSVVYGSAKWLWLAGLAFHISFFYILFRHLRFFIEPVPFFVEWSSRLDGLFEITVPTVYVTDIIIVFALTYLLLRRVFIPQLRYISITSDHFPVLLILGVALSGILMRQFFKVDLLGVKQLAVGLLTFNPRIPEGIGLAFYVHLFLVSVLVAYFPFSKLMHMAGLFLSPTRNLANNNRMRRHVNPWNYPVKIHTYEQYEDEFREKMKGAGLPLEKE